MSGSGKPSVRSETTYEARGDTYRLVALPGPELAPLVPLFADAFGGREITPDWLRRKYACGAKGVEAFCCVAFDERGHAAGSVGLLPWAARFGDHVEVCGQLIDVATGSAHRGRGLFAALAEMVRELCEAAGVGFLYGFANEAAYPIWVKKLGYEHLDDLVEYRLPVRTLPAERVARRLTPLRPLYDSHVRRTVASRAPAEPVLENSLLADDDIGGIERDRFFHGYKSAFGGSRVVALEGGRAWFKLDRGLLLGDVEARSDADLEQATRSLERLARRLGAHQIIFQASKSSRFGPFFGRRFRVLPGLPVIYRDLDSRIPRTKLRFSFGDLDNF